MTLPALLSLALMTVIAQARAQQPSFEAASIRHGAPLTDRIGDPGRITYTSVTLRDCIEHAWNLKPYQVLKSGPKVKLRPSAPDGTFAQGIEGGKYFFRHVSMDQFAGVLTGFRNRPVLNETGLTGLYDFSFDVFDDPADTKRIIHNSEIGDFISAAVEPQLGLRLESRKNPIQVLVVEQVERWPIEN